MERGLPRRSNPASDVSAASYSLYSLLQVYSSYTLVVESRAAHFQTAAYPNRAPRAPAPYSAIRSAPMGLPPSSKRQGTPRSIASGEGVARCISGDPTGASHSPAGSMCRQGKRRLVRQTGLTILRSTFPCFWSAGFGSLEACS